MSKKVLIIGSGFSGLSAASFMAKGGWDVTVVEKHDTPGGRARCLKEDGFVFDMGPSWYWMPDVFERYFQQFDRNVADYYTLKRLDPSYRIYWGEGFTNIPANYDEFRMLLDTMEPGAGEKLDLFLKEAQFKYDIGIKKLVYKPGLSILEFADWQVMKGVFRMDVFTSIRTHIARSFKNPRIRQMLEFPVLFLGALPEDTPALYSLMNYADIVGGTWYPEGGMYEVVKGMHRLAEELGVKFRFNQNVQQIEITGKAVRRVLTQDSTYEADVIIGGADYHFIENDLLPKAYQTYSNDYWDKRLMAPSCLLYYIGINKRLTNVLHHSLFFDVPFEQHGQEIYKTRKWPTNPLFYVSASSVTDPTVAPAGYENLVFLIPVAAGLSDDSEQVREKYFKLIVDRFEKHTGNTISDSIVYKKSFAYSDFVGEYNSFKGNAYGLANTLMQTAVLRPRIKSRKLSNMFYTGQLTVPGPGVPPSLISGEVVASTVLKTF